MAYHPVQQARPQRLTKSNLATYTAQTNRLSDCRAGLGNDNRDRLSWIGNAGQTPVGRWCHSQEDYALWMKLRVHGEQDVGEPRSS